MIKPLGDRVLLKPIEKKVESVGGIILPEMTQNKFPEAEVIAVGLGENDVTASVQVGDTVIYDKTQGKELSFEGVSYLLIPLDGILARLR